MVKILFSLFYGGSGASGKTAPALAAIGFQGPIGCERHIREDGDQPEPRPQIRIDEKVIPADPA